MTIPASPRFGYGLLQIHPSQQNYTLLQVVNDLKTTTVDNDGLYVYGFHNDVPALADALKVKPDQFKHHPHGNSDYYLLQVDSPEIRKQVQKLNAAVESGQEPSAQDVQTLLTLAKKKLGVKTSLLPRWAQRILSPINGHGASETPQWLQNVFDYASWKAKPEKMGLNDGFTDKKGWETSNLRCLYPDMK